MATRRFSIGVVVVLVILILFLAALLAYRSGVVSFPDGQNVLANGSFEDGTQPGGVFQPNSDGLMSLPADDTTIPGWKVLANKSLNQDVAWLQNTNRFVPNAATDGTHFLDLTGKNDVLANGHFSAVTQTFSTTPGKPYQLSFDIMVSNPSFPGPITVVADLRPAFNEQPYAQTTCGPFNPTNGGNQATTCTLRFTAATASTTLVIVGTAGKHYIGLDKVSVECVAPLGRPGFCS